MTRPSLFFGNSLILSSGSGLRTKHLPRGWTMIGPNPRRDRPKPRGPTTMTGGRQRPGSSGKGGANPYRGADAKTMQAKAQGFPARSVFKLEEIDHRAKLFRAGMRVLD